MTRYNGNQSKSIIEAYNNEDYMEVTWISDEMYPIDYDILSKRAKNILEDLLDKDELNRLKQNIPEFMRL